MHSLHNTISDIESDFGMHLICTETEKSDTLETEFGYGDSIRYHSERVNIITAWAHGFKWEHPNGGVISGSFAKPMALAISTRNEGNDEIECENFQSYVARAILQKLGKVAEIDEILVRIAYPKCPIEGLRQDLAEILARG